MWCNIKSGQCVLKPRRSSLASKCKKVKKCRKVSKKCRKLSKKCRKISGCGGSDAGSVIYVKEVKCGKIPKRCSRRRSVATRRKRLSR